MLMETVKWSQRALAGSSRRADLAGSSRRTDDFELEQVGYAETLAEGDAGWLVSPYTREEVTKLLGRFRVAARRFGFRQGTRKTAGFEEPYKHLARSSTQSWATVIGVRNPSSGAIEFCSASLWVFWFAIITMTSRK